MKLNSEQLADFARDGFVVVENFADAGTCAALRRRADELVEGFDPRGMFSVFTTREQARRSDEYFLTSGDKIRFFFEEDAFDGQGNLRRPKELSINKIGHALHDLDPVFEAFSRSAAVAELVSSLNVAEPLLVQSMYIFKQPGIGGEVTCHQDSTFLYTEPPSVAGLWLALEDATLQNGCLWALPGGHRRGLKSRFVRAPEGTTRFEVFDPTPWPAEGLVPLEVREGTLVLLDGLLPHLSRANTSPRSRHAYTLHVLSGASRYPADNWLRRAPDRPARGF
ncbi:MAG TPA: phytanoyl-CoA dioxygenase family protein [Pyrinomonadaceae bacterium]|nr:phytanoyl-CoA dioxygenase family protein [Pyrinomonadaceae bacterium]